jgi:tungstate transport system substrate-binding protein
MRTFLALLLVLAGLGAHADTPRLRLATTTSTENTGLLGALNPPFEKRHGVSVDVIATGTGKALRLAENGDVDVVLVHAPDLEQAFVGAGYGVERLPVMHNDFIIVGPPGDPAGVRSASSPAEAFARIAAARAPFVSRGDESGTHVKEKELWSAAGIRPEGEWYLSVGQGMGAVLTISDDRQAYTLSDRGTYLAYRDLELRILFEGAVELHNPYHAIVVNPARHPHVNAELAQRYADYLRSPEGQRIIREFRVSGEQLFFPDVIPGP